MQLRLRVYLTHACTTQAHSDQQGRAPAPGSQPSNYAEAKQQMPCCACLWPLLPMPAMCLPPHPTTPSPDCFSRLIADVPTRWQIHIRLYGCCTERTYSGPNAVGGGFFNVLPPWQISCRLGTILYSTFVLRKLPMIITHITLFSILTTTPAFRSSKTPYTVLLGGMDRSVIRNRTVPACQH